MSDDQNKPHTGPIGGLNPHDVKAFARSGVPAELDVLTDPATALPGSTAQAQLLQANQDRLRTAIDMAVRAGLTDAGMIASGLAPWVARHPIDMQGQLSAALERYAATRLETLKAMGHVSGQPRRNLSAGLHVIGGKTARGLG
jgi:hypothetical protein